MSPSTNLDQPAADPTPDDRAGQLGEQLGELQARHVALQAQHAAMCDEQAAVQASLDRYVHLYEQAPVAYITLTYDGLIDEINLTGAELLGLGREKLRNLPFSGFVAPKDVNHWQAHLAKARAQDPNLDCELALKRADGFRSFVHVASQRLVSKGEATTVRVILTDITERKKAEQRTAIVFRTSPIAIGIARVSDGRLVEVNEAMGNLFGWKRDEVIGKTSVEIGYWPSDEARQQWMKLLRREGELYGYEVEICDATGARRNILMSSAFIEFAGEACIVSFLPDITERKRTERYEKFRGQILELLAQDAPLARILEAIVHGVEQVNPGMLCSILLLSDDGRRLRTGAAPSLPDFYNNAMEEIEIGSGVGSCGTSAFTGTRVVVEDIQTHPYWQKHKALASRAGLCACWSQPILSPQGKVLGTFAIYYREVHTPTEFDMSTIEQLSRLTSIAIGRK